MYRDGVTVPRCQKFIGDALVHAEAACTDSRALVSGGVFIGVSENRRGTRSLGDHADLENRGMAGQTKITNGMVTCGIPPAWPPAGDRTHGFRAGAARSGGPDAARVSATTPGRGRWRQTPQWRDLGAWLRDQVRRGCCGTSSPKTGC